MIAPICAEGRRTTLPAKPETGSRKLGGAGLNERGQWSGTQFACHSAHAREGKERRRTIDCEQRDRERGEKTEEGKRKGEEERIGRRGATIPSHYASQSVQHMKKAIKQRGNAWERMPT